MYRNLTYLEKVNSQDSPILDASLDATPSVYDLPLEDDVGSLR